jgi:hypothetical protein
MSASRGPKKRPGPSSEPRKTPPAPAAAPPAPGIGASGQEDYANRFVWFPRALALLRREPALSITLGYLLLSLIGLWSSYCFYRVFRIPILEYMQPGDFLVAGVRQPMNLLWLLLMALVSVPAYWPTYYRLRHPERVERFRRHWFGRLIFSRYVDPFRRRRWYDLSPETTILLGLLLGGGSLIMAYSGDRANALLAGGGHAVRVTLADGGSPLQGGARLLGTTSGYVYLYWPDNGRTEVLVQESVSRIEALPRRVPPGRSSAMPSAEAP